MTRKDGKAGAARAAKRVKAALEGLAAPEPPQAADPKAGDPQYAALQQALASVAHLGSDEIVVDFGSGLGLLATAISSVWRDRAPPRYLAVDLQGPLDKLSLPIRIHNNSVKCEVSEFLQTQCRALADRIKLVVMRNVFHELNILQTASVLRVLNSHLPPGTGIYIQDLTRLQRAERGNAGWDSAIFEAALKSLGMSTVRHDNVSYGGTNWFAITAQSTGKQLDQDKVVSVIAESRRQQKAKMVEELRHLNKLEGEESVPEVIVIGQEIAALDLQLAEATTAESRAAPLERVKLGVSELLLRPNAKSGLFVVAAGADRVPDNTGLAAVVTGKDFIDIAAMIARSRAHVWFGGYSQKLTFAKPGNREAIRAALRSGADFRVLVSDPHSEVARIRSLEPVYASEETLIKDIENTIAMASDFAASDGEIRQFVLSGHFQVRMSQLIPPCSYFFLDDLCFLSIYSSH